MEIILDKLKVVDIQQIREKINWIELDFSSIHTLKGNKAILELTFLETKKDMIDGY